VERQLRDASSSTRTADRQIKAYVSSSKIEAAFQLMGNPRRPGPPLRRLQHWAVGLHHSVADAMSWDGLRPIPTSTHRDDVRLHAQLRGPVRRAVTLPTETAAALSGRAYGA